MMKIAVWHNLNSGGGKRALHDHLHGLVQRGHHVEAWAPSTIDADFMPLSSFMVENLVPLDLPSDATLGERFGLTPLSMRSLAAMDRHCRLCAEQIEKRDFDILFANSCYYFATSMMGRFVDLPSVLYLQEPRRFLYEALPDNPWQARPALAMSQFGLAKARSMLTDFKTIRSARVQVREEIINARAFDRILCNSHYSRESILRAYGLDAEVCYLGTDPDIFVPGSRPREDFVIGLGAFSPWKNPILCIRAVATMPTPRPRLIWVGNVSDEAYVREGRLLAKSLGVDLDIRIRIDDADLRTLLASAFAMIYASRLEPFGLAPIEASSCETPVVAVAEGGVRETIVDGVNGLLVDANPAALGQALQRVRSDLGLAEKLGRQGRQLVNKNWTLEAATTRLEEKLLSALDDPQGKS